MRSTTFCAAAAAAGLFLAAPAGAIDGTSPFELDGNAVDNSTSNPPDDWATLMGGEGSAKVMTGIPVADDASTTVFEGGDKDIMNLDVLGYVTQSVPDKDDLLNAAAAGYLVTRAGGGSDLVVYFAADRLDTNGDAFIGVWFFQQEVTTDGAGGFNGMKTQGDVLILANFTNGGATAKVEVLEWDPAACPKKDAGNSENFTVGQCPGENLQILFKATAKCVAGSNGNACAIANAIEGEDAVWPYEAKSGAMDYPKNAFFEGGANLTQLFGGQSRCFASFMVETRSSDSETAQLKDFILGSFPLCRVEIAKDCSTTGYYDTASKKVIVPWSATARNDGFAPVNITLTDDLCGYGTLSKTFSNVAPGTTVTLNGTVSGYQDCQIPAADAAAGIRNGVKAVAYDTANSAPIAVSRAGTCAVEAGDDLWCYDACGFNTDPSLALTKGCSVILVDAGSYIRLGVKYSGVVTNDSNEPGGTPTPLANVQVTDTHDGVTTGALLLKKGGIGSGATSVDLEPGEYATFESTYVPDDMGSECPSDESNSYTDTATATATSVIGGTPPYTQTPATCKVCTESCPP